ncbi:MAG: hypothetical protein H0U85_07650 [Gemmatimonadales bacterium]|nr:hypothetical protein [Gemmatimonadales bacterium]
MNDAADGAPRREARLKEEFRGLYPGIEPGVWLPASALVDAVLARARTTIRVSDPARRMLERDHFEFRGGAPRIGDVRSRSTDR